MTDDEVLQWLEQNLEKKMRKVRKQIHDTLSAEEKIFAKNTRFLISPLDEFVCCLFRYQKRDPAYGNIGLYSQK